MISGAAGTVVGVLLASPRDARELPELTADERALYLDLIDECWARVRRIEQERIPLKVAHALVATQMGI